MKILNQLILMLNPMHANAMGSVPTGDQTSVMPWLIVGIIALIILIALFITRKKK